MGILDAPALLKDRVVTKTVAPTGTVADYNTTGTADESIINTAINAVNAAGGGTVLLRRGLYILANSISVKSNVKLQGEGIGATIIKIGNGIDKQGIIISNVSNTTIRDFEIDGNKANRLTSTAQNIRIGNAAQNIWVENIYTHDAATHGFITAHDSGTSEDFITIKGCRSDNNGTSANGSGFYFNGVNQLVMTNCTAQGNVLDGIQWKTSDNLEITNCSAHGNSRFGFYAIDGYANVSNITSFGNSTIGFNIEASATPSTVVNLSNAYIYSNGTDGVRVDNSNNCSFSNVSSFNNGQASTGAGIHFVALGSGDSVLYTKVIGCSFFDNQSSATQTNGLWASGSGTIDSNTLTNNVFYGHAVRDFQQDTWGTSNLSLNNKGINPVIQFAHGTLSGTKTFGRSLGHYQRFTLGGNLTVTLLAASQRGESITFEVTQDATGGRLLTWPANVKFRGGSLTLSTAAAAIDTVTISWNGTNWVEVSRAMASAVLDMNSQKITNLATPTTSTDAVNMSYVDTADALKAPLASPALTGTPTAPTAAAGTNTTQIATTAFTKTAIDNVIAAAPGALDTLNELASALGNDANYAATMTSTLALKAPLASPTFTGTVTLPSGQVLIAPALGTPASGVATNLTGTAAGLTAGAAATLVTPRSIYGNNFDGSAALAQIIASTYGGTGNGFAKLSGPATTEKTFTLPNASATILTDNAAVTVAQGGTGQTTYTDGQILIGNTTGNTLAKGTLTGTANQITVTNAGGSITLSTPQSIASGSTPTFAGLNLGTSNLSTVGNISVDGSAARDITVARAASGAGNTLTIQPGGAQSGGTNLGAGDLVLSSGITTGNVRAGIKFNTTTQGSSGTTDNTPTLGAVMFSSTSARPILSLGNVTASSSGLIISANAFALLGTVAGAFAMYRNTTANTAGATLNVQSSGATSGATDKAAGDMIVGTGISTGTGGANVKIQTMTRALSTGTTDNTATDRIIVTSPKSITNNSATTLVSLALASNSTSGGTLRYTIEITNGTDYQVETGEVFVSGYNKAGVFGVTATKANAQQNLSTGTLATTWAISSANPAVVSINANSSLTPSTGYPRITYTYENYGQQSVTIA